MRKLVFLAILFAAALGVSAETAKADHWQRHGNFNYYVRGSVYYWQDGSGNWFYFDGYTWRPATSPFYVRPFYRPYYGPYYRPWRYRYWRDQDRDGIPNRRDRDRDGDGIPNRKDSDRDGDGIPNTKDPRP